ncbi:cytochrome c-type biogenesis protein CcmE [Slackia heliotrinireducens DSM 20476]|jgi:cytochrome c-type biogenesis protein CcmE|uniref:Cytochrome c-type biogenesis protein CcmE n=2 Tax=Slackia TaxID=84108 RepID=C7N4I5_SLAHD|nr:cytochrome c-type biogenesis protein CcmE [Slackia heliotrinireducens DSM 20476]
MMVTIIIVAVMAVILAVVGGSSAAKSISVAEAASGDYVGKRVEVTGAVVDNSFSTSDGVLTFDIYDEADPSVTVHVSYEGTASSTFGNGVQAICTGKVADDGTILTSELVTKCPSKYESATEALTVSRLLGYGESILDKPVKTVGLVKEGSLTSAAEGQARLVLVDADDPSIEVPVEFMGAIPEGIVDGTSVVITGSLSANGSIVASDVAQEA